MPGFLVQQGAMVMCAHMGQAKSMLANPRVRLSGVNALTIASPWQVSGCQQKPPVGPPCVTALMMSGSVRVKAMGMPLVIQSSQSTCVPTGTPLTIGATQLRVQAT